MYGTTQHIVVDIWSILRCVAAKLSSENLTFVRRHQRETVAEDLISETKNDKTFIKRKITGDEI